jgi:hypothetical protein
MRVGEWKKHQVSTVVLTKKKTTHARTRVGERTRRASSPANRETTHALECVGFKGERRGEGG